MHKSIGILGGMGPMATADLFQKIVALTKADSDNDHIRIYIDNNPQIPAILSGGADPVPAMTESLRKLEACGADCIVMPCNTAHYFLDRLQPETKIPFISILESTAKACAAAHPGKTACILATTGTLCTGIYEKALSQEGVAYLLPGDRHREILMDGIYRIKAGERLTDPAPFQGMLEDLQAAGADYFILGCTELPLAVEQLSLSGSFVDPTLELAKAAIRFCGGEIK